MEKFYSKVQDGLLLHIVYRTKDFSDGRFNIIEPDQFLQCSALKFDRGKTFQPHKHFIREVTDKDRIAQESWVVLKGAVKCTFYDINDTIIAEPVLMEGDASFTLHGGHTYTILENDTRVLEMKTGKYYGQELDKIFINGGS